MKLFFQVNKKKRKRGRHSKHRNEFWHHLQELVYPTIGGRAFLRFMEIKLKRARGSSHAIALGFAMGALVSFTPFVGLHSLLAIALAWPFGGSAILAVVGTIVGNPWTFPVIWLQSYSLGNFLLGREDVPDFPDVFTASEIWDNLGFYWDAYLWPMTVGGTPVGIIVAVFFYVIIYNNLNSYRKARAKHLKERRMKWLNVRTKVFNIRATLRNKALKRKPKK